MEVPFDVTCRPPISPFQDQDRCWAQCCLNNFTILAHVLLESLQRSEIVIVESTCTPRVL